MTERTNRTATVWLHQADEEFEPPQSNVLGVRVVGDRLFLMVAKESGDHTTTTYTESVDVSVCLPTFLKAVFTTVDVGKYAQFLHVSPLPSARPA